MNAMPLMELVRHLDDDYTIHTVQNGNGFQ